MDHDNAVDFSRLLGFEQVAGDLPGEIDFRSDAVGSTLGAKRGDVEASAVPCPDERDATRA